LNFSVFPLAIEEELWPFKNDSLDLIFTSLSLQWTNDLQVALARQLASLIPDGAMIGKFENL
jgi:SAM-dependent methyltransferase